MNTQTRADPISPLLCKHKLPSNECATCIRNVRMIARAHKARTRSATRDAKRGRVQTLLGPHGPANGSNGHGAGKPPKKWAPSVSAASPYAPDELDAMLAALGFCHGRTQTLARVVALMPAPEFTREELVVAAFKASPLFALDGFPQYADSHKVHEALYGASGLVAKQIVSRGVDGGLCKGPKCPDVQAKE